MADPLTYVMLLQNSHYAELLLAEDQLDDDEKKELTHIWDALKTRQESKFDAIISLIKECDKQIEHLNKEVEEVKANKNHWENKRKCIINIIKVAYEKDLIDSKPTGDRYQATIKPVKSRVIDNYDCWSDEEKQNFALLKKTTITRILDSEIVGNHQEEFPDKEKLRETLETEPEKAPVVSQLVKRVSLTYSLRKRIKKGV